MDKNGISVVINTLNEENNINACIESIRGFADEVVVCDMYSDDRTVEIARSHGAKVVFHERTGFVEPARFFAISQASYKWVLILDADERMTEKLAHKLVEVAIEDKFDVVSFWSLYWYFGDWVRWGGFFSGHWTCFFRRQTYLQTYDASEVLLHHNFSMLGLHSNKIQLSSDYFILHMAYPTIEKYITKTLGNYARIEAEQYLQQGEKFSVSRLTLLPVKIFLQRFFLRNGYRDGVRGFILSVLYSGYYFAIYANLWLLEQQKQEKGI